MFLKKKVYIINKQKIYNITGESDNTKSVENVITESNLQLCEETESSQKCSIDYKPFRGLFYICLTSVFIALTSVFVKQLSYISPGQLSMVRNIGVWVGCLPIAVYSVKEVLGAKKHRFMLIVRGLLGATAMYLNLTAYRYLPLAEAAVIMSTMPAVITLMARVYLKEPCGLVQSFALVITLCGVLLSVNLPEIVTKLNHSELDSNYIEGIASAVGCVIILSISFVALRKMKKIHFSVTLLYIGFIGMIENGAICLSTSDFHMPICGLDQILVMLIGFFGFIGHCTLTRAIQVENVGIVSVMRASMDIVVALIFQIIFFNSNPDIYNIGGAFLVIVSVSIIGLKQWLISLPEYSKTRKRLKYILL